MRRLFIISLVLSIACSVQGQSIGKFKSAYNKDDYEKARELIPSVLSQARDKYKKDPESYAELMNSVGLVLCWFDQYTKATTYFELAIKKTEEHVGDSSLYYGLYSFNLASTYDNLGRYKEAEPLYLISLPIMAKEYGQSSLDYNGFYYRLVMMYTEMGRYAEAELMNKAVIYFYETILGKSNDDYQGARNNLARIYDGMGKYAEAEEIYLSCLDHYRKQSPLKDPVLSTILNNLGELYRKTGNYEQAKASFYESLSIISRLEDPMPLDSATGCNNLALLYKAIDNYSDAERYFLKSITIYKRMGMTGHPDYTNPLNNLGDLYRVMGRYVEAVEILTKVIMLREHLYGTKHHHYANAVNNLALVYFNSGYYKEAEEMFLVCKELYYSILGENHDLYANCLNNLAVLYRVAGHPNKSEEYYIECLRITENALGKNHKRYALYLNGAGVLYSELGDSQKAIEMISRAMDIVRSQLGENNYDYIDMAYNLAEIFRVADRFDESIPLYLKSMQGYISLINSYFPTLSEKEKTDFYYTISFRFETFNSFVIEMINKFPKKDNSALIEAMYNYQLTTKSLLLNETANIKKKVASSNDTSLIALFTQWEEKQKYIALQYRLSNDELVLNEIDIDQLEKEANTLEKELCTQLNSFKQNRSQENSTWRDIQNTLEEGEVAVEMIRVEYYDNRWTDIVYYIALAIDNKCSSPRIGINKNGILMEAKFIKDYRNAIWYSKEDKKLVR